MDGFNEAISHVLGPVNNANWVRRYVTHPDNEDMEFDYTINVPLQTLVITSIFLEDDEANRYTEMHQWQLIVDSWTAEAGAQQTPLRYLGCCSTINPPVVRAIKREFDDQVAKGNAQADQEAVTVGPDATFWSDNPFIRSSEHVATALRATSGQNVRITKAHLIWIGLGQFGAQDLSIVVEFGVVATEEGSGQQSASGTTAANGSGAEGTGNDPRNAGKTQQDSSATTTDKASGAAGTGNGVLGAGTTVFHIRVIMTDS